MFCNNGSEPPRPKKSRSPRISTKVWDRHRDLINYLYVDQRLTQVEVLKALRSKGFSPSEKQLKDRLQYWQMYKYVRRSAGAEQSANEQTQSSAVPSTTLSTIQDLHNANPYPSESRNYVPHNRIAPHSSPSTSIFSGNAISEYSTSASNDNSHCTPSIIWSSPYQRSFTSNTRSSLGFQYSPDSLSTAPTNAHHTTHTEPGVTPNARRNSSKLHENSLEKYFVADHYAKDDTEEPLHDAAYLLGPFHGLVDRKNRKGVEHINPADEGDSPQVEPAFQQAVPYHPRGRFPQINSLTTRLYEQITTRSRDRGTGPPEHNAKSVNQA